MASKSQTLGMTLYTVEGDPYVTMTTHVNNTYANFQILDTFASKINTDIGTYGTRLVALSNTVSTLSSRVDTVSDKTDKNTEDLASLGLTVIDGLLCVNINS